jgi:hypothetical protein
MAIIISQDGRPKPLEADFQITDGDRPKVDELVSRLKESVQLDNKNKNKKAIILAALAELSSEYMNLANDTEQLSFLEDNDATT